MTDSLLADFLAGPRGIIPALGIIPYTGPEMNGLLYRRLNSLAEIYDLNSTYVVLLSKSSTQFFPLFPRNLSSTTLPADRGMTLRRVVRDCAFSAQESLLVV